MRYCSAVLYIGMCVAIHIYTRVRPKALLLDNITHPEEVPGGAVLQRAVLDLGLGGQVLRRVDGRHHALDREERRQIGSVRRDQDKREEPPDAADYATGDGSAIKRIYRVTEVTRYAD